MKKFWVVCLALILLAACGKHPQSVASPLPVPTAHTQAVATSETADREAVGEQVIIERDQTAVLYDGSPVPQQTLPLYYRGARDGMTWEEIAQITGFSADELRILNPNVAEDEEGSLQGVGGEICLSEAWNIPQTKVCRATVTMPGMPEPYDSRSYQLPDALRDDAARALALCYYHTETIGQGFVTETLPGNTDYVKVTSGVRFDTFSQLRTWLQSVYTAETVSDMLDGQGAAHYYKEGPADELWIQGYAFDHIIPQSGLICTEPLEQEDGSLRFAAICICVTDDMGEPLDEGAARMYYAPVRLVPAVDGWRVDTAEVPF